HRTHVRRGDHADHRVSPPQPLMQPVMPRLPDHDPVMQIPIKEHLMTHTHQPTVQLTSQHMILTGKTEEDSGHEPPTRDTAHETTGTNSSTTAPPPPPKANALPRQATGSGSTSDETAR